MEAYTVEFVEPRSFTALVPALDAFKFKPSGRAQWLQRLAWRFLNWRGAMQQALEPKATFTRHVIDADRFIDRILKQKRSLFATFGRNSKRLLIGSEDYAELMCSPEVKMHHFEFSAEVGYSGAIYGLKIEVIPWMRGAVVMP